MPLVCSGGQGSCGSICNGTYEPVLELCDGLIRFKKTNADHWIEYNIERQSWQIKPQATKSKFVISFIIKNI